jgi:uncharacterized protein with GYD domain
MPYRRGSNAAAGRRERIPIYISQGHYSREAIRGMLLKPEDREPAVAKLFEIVGGRLLGWYFTVDENGWLLIAEAPDEKTMSAAMIVVMAGGGITDMKTTAVLTSKQLMEAFKAAGEVGGSFKSAGQA